MNNKVLENEIRVSQLEHKLYLAVMDIITGAIKNFPLYRATENKKTSPIRIPFPEIPNSFFIYYPANSDHYVDKWDGKKKHCTILHGTVYEKNENEVYTKDDDFYLDPDKIYDPYTKDEFCLAFVKIIE